MDLTKVCITVCVWQQGRPLQKMFAGDLICAVCVSPGRVWLCGELSKECAQHPHRLHPLHAYLRGYCCAAFQGKVFSLHRWVQSPGEGLQVQLCSSSTVWIYPAWWMDGGREEGKTINEWREKERKWQVKKWKCGRKAERTKRLKNKMKGRVKEW